MVRYPNYMDEIARALETTIPHDCEHGLRYGYERLPVIVHDGIVRFLGFAERHWEAR